MQTLANSLVATVCGCTGSVTAICDCDGIWVCLKPGQLHSQVAKAGGKSEKGKKPKKIKKK